MFPDLSRSSGCIVYFVCLKKIRRGEHGSLGLDVVDRAKLGDGGLELVDRCSVDLLLCSHGGAQDGVVVGEALEVGLPAGVALGHGLDLLG